MTFGIFAPLFYKTGLGRGGAWIIKSGILFSIFNVKKTVKLTLAFHTVKIRVRSILYK